MTAAADVDWAATRARFHLPEGVIYLDGNSLGPLPSGVPERMERVIAQWRDSLIGGWNEGWMAWPGALGDRIGALVGAPAGSVTVGDTLSIKVHQLLAAALEMRPGRRRILSDSGNFPTDLYMAEGLIGSLDRGHRLDLAAPEAVVDALDEDVAVLMLTHVDYRTGRMHDMAAVTEAAHAVGAVVLWDLAHSAGAVPVDLAACAAEFACGCTYKYLNAGPGAPAFAYARPDLIDRVRPALSGWLGHAAPFAFEPSYRPARGIDRLRVGTPPVLQLAALEAALDAWEGVGMEAARARSLALQERLIAALDGVMPLASPREAGARGSQVSFRHPEGYAVVQALIARGVIGDFRAPDIVRFGVTPLFLSEGDVDAAAAHVRAVIEGREWDDPAFKARRAVT